MDNRIKHLRSMIMIHSYLYYQLNENLISDHKYDSICRELTEIGWKEIGWYDEYFRDFDGSTGYHLSKDRWVMGKSYQLMRYLQGLKNE